MANRVYAIDRFLDLYYSRTVILKLYPQHISLAEEGEYVENDTTVIKSLEKTQYDENKMAVITLLEKNKNKEEKNLTITESDEQALIVKTLDNEYLSQSKIESERLPETKSWRQDQITSYPVFGRIQPKQAKIRIMDDDENILSFAIECNDQDTCWTRRLKLVIPCGCTGSLRWRTWQTVAKNSSEDKDFFIKQRKRASEIVRHADVGHCESRKRSALEVYRELQRQNSKLTPYKVLEKFCEEKVFKVINLRRYLK